MTPESLQKDKEKDKEMNAQLAISVSIPINKEVRQRHSDFEKVNYKLLPYIIKVIKVEKSRTYPPNRKTMKLLEEIKDEETRLTETGISESEIYVAKNIGKQVGRLLKSVKKATWEYEVIPVDPKIVTD